MLPNRVPMETDAPSLKPIVYSFIYISQSPQVKSPPTKRGKYFVAVHGAPRERKVYINWSAAWFHKGIVYDTAITAPVPCSFQYGTFHLGLGRSEPDLDISLCDNSQGNDTLFALCYL